MHDRKHTLALAGRYGIAIVAVAVATAMRLGLDDFLGERVPFITFFLAVAFTAWRVGFGPSLFATFLSAAASAYFFISPPGFAVAGAGWVALAVFLAMGIGLTYHGEWMRSAVQRAEENAREAERKHEQLQRVEQELRQASRRKTEFLAVLAHELRNPLAPICGGIELMGMVADNPVKLDEIRRTMERQARQLRVLIDDLVDVSRITRGVLELRRIDVPLGEVIESALEACSPLIRQAGHTLTVEVPEEPVYVRADPHRLAQVLSNILGNAAKYTPQGGRIELMAERYGSDLIIRVQDNGIGIPQELHATIFEMFGQVEHPLDRHSSGLGVGLTLVKSLVEMHDGTVEVHSEGRNKGTEFRLTMPIVVEAPAIRQEGEPARAPLAGQVRLRALIADDNQAAAAMLEMALSSVGHEVRTVGDGEQAVAAAEGFRPDVILMDLGMPKMNGYEAGRLIRQQPWGKSLMLVALTGWGQEEHKQLTQQIGFDHHLVKPAGLDDLLGLLAHLQAGAGPGVE